MLNQRTLNSPIVASGVALHSGRQRTVKILPAPPNTGIVFVRTDLNPHIEIAARTKNVVCTRLATTIGQNGVTVSTIEHLVAALSAMGVDNARVEINGPEVPILDGSAEPYVSLIANSGGTVAQHRPRRFLVVKKAVQVSSEDGKSSARLEPASSFQLRCTIDFDHPLISNQSIEVNLSDTNFMKEIARARTFGFAKDVEAMHTAGLAKGGSLDNAVVIDDFSIRNPEGLRFPDEFVRHKVLDAVGDLALLGAQVIGRYVGYRSGHTLNSKLATALLSKPRAYEMVEFKQRREAERAELELPVFQVGGFATA